ncbi:hypothetical protein HYV50_04545 [Candidatus Pacearchaeota archaeon]|nr:hypothetical protein [Candidatus Pacearchaeota archaeon]
MNYQDRFALQEKKRIDALDRRDPMSYAKLCDELGVSPEIQDLYEDGEKMLVRARNSRAERLALRTNGRGEDKIVKYASFLEEVAQEAINVDRLSYQPDSKRTFLIKYFPEKFDDNGKQPIRDYDPVDVGVVFRRMVNHANKSVYGRRH